MVRVRFGSKAALIDELLSGEHRDWMLFELDTAARTNPEPRTAFQQLEEDVRAGTLAVTRAVYPERRDAEGIELYSLLTLVLMQGAAMHDNALGPQAHVAALKPLFVQALDALLPAPPG
jgi:hypothetical protein